MALVLSRRNGETLELHAVDDIPKGTVIRVTVLTRSGHGQAQLAVDAPLAVKILRAELEPEEKSEILRSTRRD